jgi:hypothetical protein
MEFHTNAEIQSLFDSFLHSDIWNLEEHRAACEWFMGPHQSLPSDLPWALFDACQQAKDLERRGILRREEFVLEKEWLYATFSSSDISEDTKQHLPKARFIAFENAKKIFDEEIRVNAFQACENFDIRKNTIRKNSVYPRLVSKPCPCYIFSLTYLTDPPRPQQGSHFQHRINSSR